MPEHQDWKLPKSLAKTNKLSRPGYSNMKADEYQDDEATLQSKLAAVAKLLFDN